MNKKIFFAAFIFLQLITLNHTAFACSIRPAPASDFGTSSLIVPSKNPDKEVPLVRIDTHSLFDGCDWHRRPLSVWDIVFRNGISIPFLLPVALVVVIGLLLFLVYRRNLKKIQ